MVVCRTTMTRRKKLLLAFLGAVCILGLLAVIYPLLSAAYAGRVQSQILTQYRQDVQQSGEALDAIREAAQQYNAQLWRGELDILTPEANGYDAQLCVPGSEVMAYIRIPKIDVSLPIYHGTGSDALYSGVGHIPQTSLPIGGENTHTALSAHTGMAGSPMFTDLELLALGDRFYIDVLGETLAYEVDQIDTVLPQDVSKLQIVRGEDLCTLVTCTPYGINTHRLLVRGHRIALPPEAETSAPETAAEGSGSVWRSQYLHTLLLCCAGLAVPLLLLVALLIRRRKERAA